MVPSLHIGIYSSFRGLTIVLWEGVTLACHLDHGVCEQQLRSQTAGDQMCTFRTENA
jgi:hypothetical protein